MKAKVVRLRDVTERSTRWSDEAVAAACAAGDSDAVAELFDRFEVPVTRFLSKVVDGAPDVEDLVQATFLEVARGNTRFEGRSKVSTWLFGIAANVARHHKRSLSRHGAIMKALAVASKYQPPPPALSDVAAARQQLEVVASVLERLSVKGRAALVLCELEGLSAREAAEALGMTETAVWKQVARAREALIRAVDEEGS